MATHRVIDSGSSTEIEFHLTLNVLEAAEHLSARRRPITPANLARWLRHRIAATAPTPAQIEAALHQIDDWRQHVLTRDLLQYCRQLVAQRDRVEAAQRQLAEDWVYLNRMLQDAQARLEITPPPGDQTLAGASANPPLQ